MSQSEPFEPFRSFKAGMLETKSSVYCTLESRLYWFRIIWNEIGKFVIFVMDVQLQKIYMAYSLCFLDMKCQFNN